MSNRVTSSDVLDLSDVFRCLPVFGHSLIQRIYLWDFYVKHEFPSHMLRPEPCVFRARAGRGHNPDSSVLLPHL